MPTIPLFNSALKLLSIFFFISSFGLLSCKKDQELKSEAVGTIVGKVKNEFGNPLSDVVIQSTSGNGAKGSTDISGYYSLNGLKAGKIELIAIKEGYLSEIKTVDVIADNSSTLDFVMKSGSPSLEISELELSFSSSGGDRSIQISSNSAWAVSTDSTWIKINKTLGQGNGAVEVNVAANEKDVEREGRIFFSNGSTSKTVIVRQRIGLKLLTVSLTEPLSDSITVMFNKPITLVNLKSSNQSCLIGQPIYVNQRRGIRFKFGCADLGQSYPFTIEVSDDNGEKLRKDFNAEFYSAIIKFPKTFNQGPPILCLSENNSVLWYAKYDSKEIDIIDIESFSIQKTFQVSFRVRSVAFNPYNKLLYVLSDTPHIYVLNPNNGAVVKIIDVEIMYKDNQSYPEIYPEEICFMKSGYGVFTARAKSSSGMQWKIIDSSKDDIIYYHNAHKISETAFGNLVSNYNGTEIYMKPAYLNTYYTLTQYDNQLKQFPSFGTSGINDVVPNKKNANLFISQRHEQFIYNPKSNYLSAFSYIFLGGLGDFSYREGEENVIYTLNNASRTFTVLDYSSSKTILDFRVPNMETDRYCNPISTTDGKYVLIYYDWTLHKFNSELFKKNK